MKTQILFLTTILATVMFGGALTANAQGKPIYFMKDGNAVYSSTTANIDSIIIVQTPSLSVEPSTLSFSAAATESYNVIVNTNQSSWNATSDQTWCKVTKGTSQFTVTATVNTGASRTATITVTAGNAPKVTLSVTQTSVSSTPNILFSAGSPAIEYLYTNGFFEGSRVNFIMYVYDTAGLTSITITEVAKGTTPNGVSGQISQTRVIPISGAGPYALSQEMWNGNQAYASIYGGFTYTVSAYGKSYTTTYSGSYDSYMGNWSHYFGIK